MPQSCMTDGTCLKQSPNCVVFSDLVIGLASTEDGICCNLGPPEQGPSCQQSLNGMSCSNLHTPCHECCCLATGLSTSAAKTGGRMKEIAFCQLTHSSSRCLGECVNVFDGKDRPSRGEQSVLPCCWASMLAFSSLSCPFSS